MKPSRCHIAFTLAIAAAISVSAQNPVKFAYDDAGNRVKREISFGKQRKVESSTKKKSTNSYDSLGDDQIRITYDPSWIINIDFLSFGNDDRAKIEIFNLNGLRLLSEMVTEQSVDIDISGYTSGVYILSISLNEASTSWKIYKE